MKLSGLTILRNGINCGYTFVETIKTLLACCDEVIVYEGHSTDATYEILQQFKEPRLRIIRAHWANGSNGTEFARATNEGLRLCAGDYVFYLQADEVIHEADYPRIRNLLIDQPNSISCRFIHLRYGLEHAIAGDQAYDRAIRIIRNSPAIGSLTDGYSFQGAIEPQLHSDIIIYHAGYVFLENILNKMINHASHYYVGNDNYQRRAAIASKLVEQLHLGELTPAQAHLALEPFYHLVPHGLPIPELLQPHWGATRYVPRI